jgi:hypothetical protein
VSRIFACNLSPKMIYYYRMSPGVVDYLTGGMVL